MGINFYDYLTRIRLREATLELSKSDKIISDIALSNGFSDIKAFNKAFKTAFGKTPTEYRNQLNHDTKQNDSIFKREFVSLDDEYVNNTLMEYVTDKHSDSTDNSPKDIKSNYNDTIESLQLKSEDRKSVV